MEKFYVSKNHTYDMNMYDNINGNILVCGAPGTGKTRNVVLPNLLLNTKSSFVINDSKGMIYKHYGAYFEQLGYKVVNVDFINLTGHYNIFSAVKNDYDILKLAHLLSYLDAKELSTRDPFWDEESEICLACYISFMFEFLKPEERTLSTLSELMTHASKYYNTVCPDGSEIIHNASRERIISLLGITRMKLLASDLLFYLVSIYHPDSFALKEYRKICSSPEKTYGTIITTTLSKIGIYDTQILKEFTKQTDVSFHDLGYEKCAFFISVSDNDRTMDVLANILYTQIIQNLIEKADKEENGRLPQEVDLYFDDFATSVKITDFPRMIASFRSRGIQSILLIQNEAQLATLYGQEAKTIIGSSAIYCYLGNMDIDTIKNISYRMNLPIQDIIGLPRHQMILHRQGELPYIDTCLSLEDILLEEDLSLER